MGKVSKGRQKGNDEVNVEKNFLYAQDMSDKILKIDFKLFIRKIKKNVIV